MTIAIDAKPVGAAIRRLISRAALCLSACLPISALAVTSPPPATQAARFDTALEAYRAGRFPTAYGELLRLAGEGHAEAARIVLLMHRFGVRLFGSDWDATPDQIQRWLALATLSMQEQGRLSAE